MIKKTLFTIVLISISALSLNAQIHIDDQGNISTKNSKTSVNTKSKSSNIQYKDSKNSFDKSKLVFGGSFGMQFGNKTSVNISPQLGYAFSKYITLGAGLGYTYYKDKHYGDKYNAHYASANLYTNLYPIPYIVLSVQPEANYMWSSLEYEGSKTSDSRFVPSVLLGGGIRIGNITAMIKYDIVQNDYTPYSDKISIR